MQYDVLMVDDEQPLAESVPEYLSAFGLRSAWVGSAEAALEFLAEHPTRLLLLDIGLPGMDGFAFCRTVRETRSLPIVFLSARGGDDDQVLALTIGGDDYVRKPVSLSVLLAKIRRILERLGGGDLADGVGETERQDARESAAAQTYDDGRLRFDPVAQRFLSTAARSAAPRCSTGSSSILCTSATVCSPKRNSLNASGRTRSWATARSRCT